MHQIVYDYFDLKEKDKINSIIVNTVKNSGDRYGTNNIKFINKTFETELEATNYIDELDSDWYQGYAVMFKKYENRQTKKIQGLQEQIKSERKKKNEYITNHNVKLQKASFIGCAECGSKLNKEYIYNNICPVCHNNLLSQTVKNRIEAFDDKISRLNQKIEDEYKKQKFVVKWLVKYEYHC